MIGPTDRELLLDECAEFLTARGLRPRAILVHGAPGIGKSTFLDLLHAELLARGVEELVVLDDVDAATPSERDRALERVQGSPGLRLVVTARELPEALVATVERACERRIVELPPMSEMSARGLLEQLGVAPWSAHAAQVIAAAGGNPRQIVDTAFATQLDVEQERSRAGDEDSLPRALRTLLRARVVDGGGSAAASGEAARALLEDGVHDAGLVDSEADAIAVCAERAAARGELEHAIQLAARAAAAPLEGLAEPDRLALRWAALVGSAARALRGEPTAMLALHAQAGAAARAQLPLLEIRAWQLIAWVAGGGGDTKTALRATTRAIQLADMSGRAVLGMQLRITLAQTHLAQADHRAAIPYAAEVAEVAGACGLHVLRADALLLHARARLAIGELATASADADAAMQLVLDRDLDRSLLVDARIVAARATAATGGVRLAIAALGDVDDLIDREPCGLEFWLALEGVRITAAAAEERGLFDAWLARLARIDGSHYVADLRAARAEADAWRAHVEGRRMEARRLAERARSLWAAAGCMEEVVFSDTLVDIDMGGVPQRVPIIDTPTHGEPITGALPSGAPGAAAHDPPAFGVLTKREREIARYVAGGLTNPEIARELHLSPRTVEHHVASILRKLELPSRRALVLGQVN